MNTYLLPYFVDGDVLIERVKAKDYNNAKEKFMEFFDDEFMLYDREIYDWDSMLNWMSDNDIFVGDIYDLEEF